MKKQDDLIQVFQSGQSLQHAIHLARGATIDMSYARLSLPLLLLSGRRTTELLNGKVHSFEWMHVLQVALLVARLRKGANIAPTKYLFYVILIRLRMLSQY